MKKSLLFASAAFMAIAANAETFTYDFYSTPPFCAGLMDENSDVYQGGGNYDFIDKYGDTVNTDGEHMINTPEGAEKGVVNTNRVISLYDGQTYTLTPDAAFEEEYSRGVLPEDYWNYPVIGWGEKGLTRTLLMTGWGSLDEYKDDNYNAATPADWVPTKNGIAFNRLGTQNIVSRNDTYLQFPAVTGNVTVTVWAGTASDKSSREQPIRVLVTPVIDGVADADKAVVIEKAYGTFPEKRMVKLDPVKFDATGKKLALRVGCDGAVLHVYHVVIEGDKIGGESGIENIIATEENVNAPVYNVLGQRVNENYKGLVIKNGKKYVQK